MIRVLIRLEAGAGGQTTVRAESIRQALAIARRSHPGARASVVFPIDGESFFVKGSPGGGRTKEGAAPRADRRGPAPR
ncbi:hypothetical protein [Rubrobacter xylanophilus]|uniref:hypothetical protein n=1 Tax=Rubrobacter xylanophilus TaxID=49319 RepID=UPI00003A20B7|nr:hypothetical protein [Rubrobacter xylanophilus]